MECEATLFVTKLLPYLEDIVFPTVSLIFTTDEVVLYSDIRKNGE